MSTPIRRRTAAVLLACAALLPSACGLQSGYVIAEDVQPGTVGKGRPLEGATLTVTSKEFSEQLILGQILGLALKAAGADVVDKTNIQGSIGAREAVRQGVADVMYEYTGTAWITYLGETEPIDDPQKQWQAVKDADEKNGITWLPPAELDNTYALAVTEETQKKYDLKTLSDLAALTRKDPKIGTFCVEPEFNSRDDGWPGVQKLYDFKTAPGGRKVMQTGLVYTQVSKGGVCTAGEVFTTDGRVKALNLKALEDDKQFFPNYNAAPEVYTKTLKKHPEIADVLAPITKALDNETALNLNVQVDVDGKEPRDVAKEWLVEEGFIKLPEE